MLFPYSAFRGGVVPAIVGIAMVPISLVLITQAVFSRDARPGSTSDAGGARSGRARPCRRRCRRIPARSPSSRSWCVLLVLERSWRERSWQTLLRALTRGLTIALLALILLAPTLRDFVAGAGERSSILFVTPDPDYRSFFKPILTLETGDPFAPERQVFLGCHCPRRRGHLRDPTPAGVGGRLGHGDDAGAPCQHLGQLARAATDVPVVPHPGSDPLEPGALRPLLRGRCA